MYNFFFLFFFIFLLNQLCFAEDSNLSIKFVEGKPYKINGKWYYPKNNFNYNEIGIATVNSKKKFKTKNGEIFSNDEIVAKHKTLALPSIVRVTNLKNGYSINIRINHRGPKNNFRIIEISKRAANFLKIKDKGLVEVKIIPDLTLQEQNKLKSIDSKYTDENLEKDFALGRTEMEIEDLMTNKSDKKLKKKINTSKKKEYQNTKVRLNFKKKRIQPYYLKIEITKFKNFKDAANLKIKLKPIYDKILISLTLINEQKYYKITTVPIKNLDEAEKILSIIHKKGFKNAKLFINRKKR